MLNWNWHHNDKMACFYILCGLYSYMNEIQTGKISLVNYMCAQHVMILVKVKESKASFLDSLVL